jgi:hypothetical protein
MSSDLLFDGPNFGEITRRSLESIFNCSPESEADSATEALSSCSKHRHFDHTFYTGTDYREYRLPRDTQVIELCDLSSDVDIGSKPEDFTVSSPSYCEDSDARFEDRTSISYCEDVEPTELSTPLSISLSDSQSECESITDLFIELFYSEQHSSELAKTRGCGRRDAGRERRRCGGSREMCRLDW